jgi:hypothetical protein
MILFRTAVLSLLKFFFPEHFFQIMCLTQFASCCIAELNQFPLIQNEVTVRSQQMIADEAGIVRGENDLKILPAAQQFDNILRDFVVIESIEFINEQK